MRITRCYRILGLPPGASQAEIKQAYRDLVQVWHPDRFAHDARLQQKAQNNLKRINEAFEVLLSYNPPKHPSPFSRLTGSFSAVLDIGDMLKTGEYARPPQGPHRFHVWAWRRSSAPESTVPDAGGDHRGACFPPWLWPRWSLQHSQ